MNVKGTDGTMGQDQVEAEVEVEVEASRDVYARLGSKLPLPSEEIGSLLPRPEYMLCMPQPQPR